MSDPVKSPEHYEGDGVTTCEVALDSMMCKAHSYPTETGRRIIKQSGFYWWGCALKYVWRWPHKNGLQDIDKAIESLIKLRKAVE